ncbi:MAG: PadR family transcriptional regulator [Coriobacteriales bacterium]|nr:PadR family transcriptional regulator [Coriobacteriales bacterium]
MDFPISATLLDACVLASLSKGDSYGYEITQNLSSRLETSESTIYPVLRRLLTTGFLSSYDQPYQGRNRRYYSISTEGSNQLANYRQSWREFKNQIDSIMGSDS